MLVGGIIHGQALLIGLHDPRARAAWYAARAWEEYDGLEKCVFAWKANPNKPCLQPTRNPLHCGWIRIAHSYGSCFWCGDAPFWFGLIS